MRGGEGGLLIRKVEEEEVDKVEVKISLSPCHKLHMVKYPPPMLPSWSFCHFGLGRHFSRVKINPRHRLATLSNFQTHKHYLQFKFYTFNDINTI